MRLGKPDATWKKNTPEIESGSEYKIHADLVIKSLGFDQIYQNYLIQKSLLFLNGEQ